MLELVYDTDVAVAGVHHTLELYLDEDHRTALAVLFQRDGVALDGACTEAWTVATHAAQDVAPYAQLRVLRRAAGRQHWLETNPPGWRDAADDEVLGIGLPA